MAEVWCVWVMPKWNWWLVSRHQTEADAMLVARRWAESWFNRGARPRTWRGVLVTRGAFGSFRKVHLSTTTIWRRERANDPNWKGRDRRRMAAG